MEKERERARRRRRIFLGAFLIVFLYIYASPPPPSLSHSQKKWTPHQIIHLLTKLTCINRMDSMHLEHPLDDIVLTDFDNEAFNLAFDAPLNLFRTFSLEVEGDQEQKEMDLELNLVDEAQCNAEVDLYVKQEEADAHSSSCDSYSPSSDGFVGSFVTDKRGRPKKAVLDALTPAQKEQRTKEKRQQRKVRNRALAAASRERRKHELETLRKDNHEMGHQLAFIHELLKSHPELQAQVQAYQAPALTAPPSKKRKKMIPAPSNSLSYGLLMLAVVGLLSASSREGTEGVSVSSSSLMGGMWGIKGRFSFFLVFLSRCIYIPSPCLHTKSYPV